MELAAEVGFPVCASSELSGLRGLELRAVTAALNASIFPIAIRTADVVERGVAEVGIECPVMVMRGDGGATDLAGFRRAPARTLYSGPGGLGGRRPAPRPGRQRRSWSRSAGRRPTWRPSRTVDRRSPTSEMRRVTPPRTPVDRRALAVIGVAGGSMLRVRRRGVYGVGPRSAHIAGVPYSCFVEPALLAGATAIAIAPRPGDPDDYLVLEAPDGSRVAISNTCAANHLGVVQPGDYAEGNRESAALAFTAAARVLKLSADEIARRMLEASAGAISELIGSVMHDHSMERATIVAVGGGAGGVGRYVAARLGLECIVPPNAEIISSIGDALSMVRAST